MKQTTIDSTTLKSSELTSESVTTEQSVSQSSDISTTNSDTDYEPTLNDTARPADETHIPAVGAVSVVLGVTALVVITTVIIIYVWRYYGKYYLNKLPLFLFALFKYSENKTRRNNWCIPLGITNLRHHL